MLIYHNFLMRQIYNKNASFTQKLIYLGEKNVEEIKRQ